MNRDHEQVVKDADADLRERRIVRNQSRALIVLFILWLLMIAVSIAVAV